VKRTKAEAGPRSGSRPSQRGKVDASSHADAPPPTTRSGRESDASVLERVRKSLHAVPGMTAEQAQAHFETLKRIYEAGGRDEAIKWGTGQGITDAADAFNQWVEQFTERAKELLRKAA
jgi:hypothetical protein